jgi:hypothetical protein
MDKPEFSCTLLSKLNLDDIEKVVKEAYHKEDGPGRPPRKPMGIFKALIVKRLQQIPSERELFSTHGVKVVIPYPANQNKENKTLLRVDKYFRTHGPARERQIYNQRGAIERVNSRLKEQLCLERHRARGLERITVHALLCIIAMLLNALTALRLNRPEKARSITMLTR